MKTVAPSDIIFPSTTEREVLDTIKQFMDAFKAKYKPECEGKVARYKKISGYMGRALAGSTIIGVISILLFFVTFLVTLFLSGDAQESPVGETFAVIGISGIVISFVLTHVMNCVTTNFYMSLKKVSDRATADFKKAYLCGPIYYSNKYQLFGSLPDKVLYKLDRDEFAQIEGLLFFCDLHEDNENKKIDYKNLYYCSDALEAMWAEQADLSQCDGKADDIRSYQITVDAKKHSICEVPVIHVELSKLINGESFATKEFNVLKDEHSFAKITDHNFSCIDNDWAEEKARLAKVMEMWRTTDV